jgi:hypothetical protein
MRSCLINEMIWSLCQIPKNQRGVSPGRQQERTSCTVQCWQQRESSTNDSEWEIELESMLETWKQLSRGVPAINRPISGIRRKEHDVTSSAIAWLFTVPMQAWSNSDIQSDRLNLRNRIGISQNLRSHHRVTVVWPCKSLNSKFLNLSIWNSLTGLALWNVRLTSRRICEILISRPFRCWVLWVITCFWSWLIPMTKGQKRQNWGETDQFDFLRGSDKMMSLIDLSNFLTV